MTKIQHASSDEETEAEWGDKGLAQGHTESVLGRSPVLHVGSF